MFCRIKREISLFDANSSGQEIILSGVPITKPLANTYFNSESSGDRNVFVFKITLSCLMVSCGLRIPENVCVVH